MDFRHRAHTALERKSPGRALMLLVRGLRREPEYDDAVDLLLYIYIHHIGQPGLESELFRGLEFHPDRDLLLRWIVDGLCEEGKPDMAREVKQWARRHEISIAPPQVEDEPKLQPEAKPLTEPPEESDGDMPSPEIPAEHSTDIDADDGQKGESEGIGWGEPEESEGLEEQEEPGETDIDEHHPSKAVRLPRTGRIFSYGVAVLAAVIAVSVGVIVLQHAREVQRMRMVDEAMITLDALAPQDVVEVLDDAEPATGRGRREFVERRRFIRAIQRLEAGEIADVSDVDEETFETSWGLAAAALEATGYRDWEQAMRFAHHLERAHGDSLPAYYARGRICEARRDWECAIARYSRVGQHFEEFVPAYAGLMRIAAHRFDEEAWQRMAQRIAQIDADHPYAQLRWNDIFAQGATTNDMSKTGRSSDVADRFVQRWSLVTAATDDARSGRWDEVLAVCTELIDDEQWNLASLYILCARGAADSADAQRSWGYFEVAAFDETLSPPLQLQVQLLAPPALSDLGRADQALALSIPFGDDSPEIENGEAVNQFVAEADSRRPAHFHRYNGQGDAARDEALLVRARVLSAAGATEHARRALAAVIANGNHLDQARFEVAWTYLMEGNRDGAERSIGQIGDEQLAAGVRGYLAYLEGRYGDARDAIVEEEAEPRLVRIRALAFLADGRAREALAALDSVQDGLDSLSLVSVRMHIVSRIGDDASLRELEELVPNRETVYTVDHLIDRAQAYFWKRQLEASTELLERVLEFVPTHPEANWQMGLRRRMEGGERSARLHFQRAWRDDRNSTELLIESGRVHLEYGRYERAREVFLRIVIRDRRNVDAIAGLGRAYEGGDRQRGRRDLVELLDRYSNEAVDRTARVEMKRWLAIVSGSRRGEEEALPHLEQARQWSGDGALILSELGRFHLAREEWEEARQYYAKGLRVDPTLPDIHLGLARVALANEEMDAAQEHLKRLLRTVPTGEMRREAGELLAEIEEAQW